MPFTVSGMDFHFCGFTFSQLSAGREEVAFDFALMNYFVSQCFLEW